MSCNCQEVAEKEKKDIENSLKIPFAAHESAMGREERHIKALIWVIVLLIVLLVGSNGAWLWYENQLEVVEETTTTIAQDNADGYNNYIGNDGDIVNGKADNNN